MIRENTINAVPTEYFNSFETIHIIDNESFHFTDFNNPNWNGIIVPEYLGYEVGDTISYTILLKLMIK